MIAALAAARAIAGEELYREALRAEREGNYERAIAACGELERESQESPRIPACQRRTEALERRRDLDGSFASWSELQRVREGFRALPPEAREAAVAEIVARDSAAPVVRAEAALWLAKGALDAGEPEAALAWLDRRPETEEEGLEAKDKQLRALALAALGRGEEARALQAQVRVEAKAGGERPTPVDAALSERRWQKIALVASACVALFAALTAPIALRGFRSGRTDPRQIVPMGALPILVSSVFAYGIAEGWQRGAGVALPYMCAGSLAVHLLSLWALASCEGRLALVVRIAALAATLSVALLALWATGSTAWVFRW